ncbi:MAG: hypothetical protein OWU32_07855 [Firmicutes bacterium]|nr:hypothetical protein [Bacillota bacterium]
MHPLYHHARRLVGQPVYVHAYGRVHHGILHHVTNDGVYLRQSGGTRMATAEPADRDVETLPLCSQDEVSADTVFWPFFFLPWLAIGALGAGWWW